MWGVQLPGPWSHVLSWALMPVSREEWALGLLCCVSLDALTHLSVLGRSVGPGGPVEPCVVASASVGLVRCGCSGRCR